MADDLANLCRFLFDDTAFPSLSSSASSDLFSRRLRSDDSIKRGLRYFYLLLRWGIAPIGGDDDSSSKLRFETWSDSQVQSLVSISQAILLLSRSLLVDQLEPIVLGVIQEVMEFSLSFLEKSNFRQNDLKMEHATDTREEKAHEMGINLVQWAPVGDHIYTVKNADGEVFAVVENPGFWNWTYTVKDADGEVLAQTDRDWRGFGFEMLGSMRSDSEKYAIRFGKADAATKLALRQWWVLLLCHRQIEELEVKRRLTLT